METGAREEIDFFSLFFVLGIYLMSPRAPGTSYVDSAVRYTCAEMQPGCIVKHQLSSYITCRRQNVGQREP